MARPRKHSKYPKFKVGYVTGDMDLNFIVRNWASINRTPIRRAGLLVRKIMRGSIRRAYVSKKTGRPTTRPSKPGKPPKSRHVGHPFKMIFSIPNAEASRAVIGHKILPYRKQDSRVTPMEAHEFGRMVTIKTIVKQQRSRISRKQRKAARRLYLQGRLKSKRKPAQFVTRRVRMPKREFAEPALKKSIRKLGWLWKDKIRRSTIRSQKVWF